MSTNAGEQQAAIVTGASSGLGLGITRALLQRGFRVVANSRTVSKSKELKPSADLVLVDGDIGIKETASKVAEAAVNHFGRIDLLVNNAGIYISKPFTEYTSEDFETNIHVNVAGYFFVTQQAVAQMRKQKSGHILSHFGRCGRSALGRCAQRTADHHQIHHPRVQPRLGDGIRGRGDSGPTRSRRALWTRQCTLNATTKP
jgi:NAD(P)-dependent dehydrogenase (short-subunit alcohol dehydrogenase family)